MTTNGCASATVQTLTAEVRTLMVGSRQVTLSVFNQLDTRPVDEIDVFGRVRHRDASSDSVNVVGRSREDGTLVRGCMKHPIWRQEPPEAFSRWICHLSRTYVEKDPDFITPSYSRDWEMAVRIYRDQRLLWGFRSRDLFTLSYTPDQRDELHYAWQKVAERQLAALKPEQDRYDELSAHPLIVLAGLR
jgi:hypothetical protein